MTVFWFIYFIISIWVMFFLLIYSYDLPELDKNDHVIDNYRPSISNLKLFDRNDDGYKKYFDRSSSMRSICIDVEDRVKKYVNDVIKPSNSYFVLKNRYSDLFCYKYLFPMICLQLASMIMFLTDSCKYALKLFPNISLPKALYSFIVFSACVVLCTGGCALITAIYISYKNRYRYRYEHKKIEIESIDKLCEGKGEEYGVSDRAGFLDNVILDEYEYLWKHENEIIRKNTLSIILTVLAVENIILSIVLFM